MIGRTLGVLAVVAVTALVAPTAAPVEAETIDTTPLRDAVTVPGIREHLGALQRIADESGGNRALGTPGYAASVDYVRQRLASAGYQVSTQRFRVGYFAQNGPEVLSVPATGRNYAPNTEIRTLRFSGNGDVTARVVPVDLSLEPGGASTSGCEPADFAGFPRGAVALIKRGTCSFRDKARHAQDAGAAAVLVMNDGSPDNTEPFRGTLEEPGITIPVLAVAFPVGAELAAPGDRSVRVAANTVSEFRETDNVIAESTTGRPDQVVMVGAHLDSVPKGPGINDNGSGTATVLEIAEQLSQLQVVPRNRVRFAFWGAEELGMLGSEHYVESLTPAQRRNIALYLNFDMVGSPNFARFVHVRTPGSPPPDAEPDEVAPPGSERLTEVFAAYFRERGLAWEPEPLEGRSDYGPFAAAGIPVGGVFSGAERVKSPELAERHGGTVGRPLDHCYHQACDTVANINDEALDQLGDAAAHAVMTFVLTARNPRPVD